MLSGGRSVVPLGVTKGDGDLNSEVTHYKKDVWGGHSSESLRKDPGTQFLLLPHRISEIWTFGTDSSKIFLPFTLRSCLTIFITDVSRCRLPREDLSLSGKGRR